MKIHSNVVYPEYNPILFLVFEIILDSRTVNYVKILLYYINLFLLKLKEEKLYGFDI